MGRIRTIKPEFFLHEGLFDLEEETGLPVRLAFAGLWCQADREGRFRWSARRLKTQILPYDSHDFSRVLDALTTRDFIRKYAVNGEFFGVIPGFSEHQVINNREKDSSLPDPSSGAACDASVTREPREGHAPSVEGKGREGKGRELVKPQSPQPRAATDDTNPRYLEMAEYMAGKIAPLTKQNKPPKLHVWADHIRKLVEIDDRELGTVYEVFDWANQDDFWKTNILSAAKLREQFPMLYAKSRKAAPPDFSKLAREAQDLTENM